MDRSADPTMGYFDHAADIGIVGRGPRVEDAFVAAARATFAIMTDVEAVRPRERVDVAFEEPDTELALVRWLNLLLGHAHERGLVLGRFELARAGDVWRGSAWGEPWRESLEHGTDVKGATLTALAVRGSAGRWEARCVVDV